MTVTEIAPDGELVHRAALAPAVKMRWNPSAPRDCTGAAVELLDTGVEFVREVVALPGAGVGRWCRLASLMSLDHLLRVPLNRSLLDAELAAAQLEAARSLPDGEQTREWLIRNALHRGRLAGPGVARYLDHLAVGDCCPPPALSAAVDTLAVCYSALAGEVREPDGELDAVVEACRRLSLLDGTGARNRVPAPLVEQAAADGTAEDLLDPRLLPARGLGFGLMAHAATIGVTAVQWKGRPAVRVRVPASGPGQHGGLDIAVRLVDRRTGEVRGHGLLGGLVTQPPRDLGEVGERYYEGTVVLPAALALEDVRVDVGDAAAEWPAHPPDRDELRRVWQATVFLSAWRALVADVRMWGSAAKPAARLRRIARQLTADATGDRTAPLWAGGPAPSTLWRLVGRGDRSLAAALGGRDGVRLDENARSLIESVSGAGELLVAELAAAYERSILL